MRIFLVSRYGVLNGPSLFFSGLMAAAAVLTLLLYSNRFSWPFQQVMSIAKSGQEAKAVGGRILGLLN